MTDDTQCCKRVFNPGGTFRGSRCKRKAHHTHTDGKRYCATHYPPNVEERRANDERRRQAAANLRRQSMPVSRVVAQQLAEAARKLLAQQPPSTLDRDALAAALVIYDQHVRQPR